MRRRVSSSLFERPSLTILSVTMQRDLLSDRWTATVRQRSRFVRAFVGAWLAVHAFVIAAAPVADALTDHSSAMAVHWEDAQDTNCPPPHGPEACRLCQVISTTFGRTVTPEWGDARLRLAAAPPPTDAGLGAQPLALRGSPHPRGPPTV